MRWNTVALIGVGLIGGSIGLALRRGKHSPRVIGFGRSSESLQQALQHGAISEATTELPQAVSAADFVVVCTPVEQIADLVLEIAGLTRPPCVITDVGSTKGRLVEQVARDPLATSKFVGSHPLAGSEKSGVAHASAELFADRRVVLTPTAETPASALDSVHEFWRHLGAETTELSPQQHDEALAFTSHLPHLIASVLAAGTPTDYLSLTATGWRDSTRIASGDPELWRQILAENREATVTALEQFAHQLDLVHQWLRHADDQAIEVLLRNGKQNRDALGS